jgi:hypothetical protein
LDRGVKYFLACAVSFVCAGCDTLENRRDLYNPDTYFYRHQPVTTTVRQSTTTATTSPVEFRPHAGGD